MQMSTFENTSTAEAKKSNFYLWDFYSWDFPSRTIFPNATSQPIMHPDEYEIMANYFSDNFEEQIGFLKVVADLDNEPFLPLIKDISFLTTNITDEEWITYHKQLGLTQTPRILILTSFTKTAKDLQDLLLLTPYVKTLRITKHTSISCADLFTLKTLTYTWEDSKNNVNLPHILQFFGAIETLYISCQEFRNYNLLSNRLNPYLQHTLFDFDNTSLNTIIVDNYNNVQIFVRSPFFFVAIN